ncbi:hypothetical protein RJ639_009400 [Escallonia herrerae]|uniref:CRM domain-containing protein n=1 Tax=Escallonia herrerae TaxID=1293975 RepID=A0AA88VUX9_9ASTE|nr:hypothetical protein RJ639_009400 [Escallonia herrerae]
MRTVSLGFCDNNREGKRQTSCADAEAPFMASLNPANAHKPKISYLFSSFKSKSTPRPLLYLSRFLHQSHSVDGHDPPFTPTAKTLKPETLKTNKRKKKKTQHQDSSNSSKAHNFPVNSGLPFDFRYSYSETNPSVEPIGFREPPRFSPFGPGRLDRKWTGTLAPAGQPLDTAKLRNKEMPCLGIHLLKMRSWSLWNGKGGVTHNMPDDIHNHWKRAEAVRIKCLGVPTLDMDNPYAPIYPKLVKSVADGLTFEETKEMRNRGLNSSPLMKLTRKGVYVNVVDRVREAFNTEDVVRLDCTHASASDCQRIGVKLRDLVPCLPILYKDEQIILWRGKMTSRTPDG